MAQMLAEADKWLIAAALAYSDAPARLPAHMTSSRAMAAVGAIYSRNWPAVKAYAEARLGELPWIDPHAFIAPLATLALEAEMPPVFALLVKREQGLLTLRFFEPNALAATGYAMLTGARMPSAEIMRNTASAGFISRKVFRTELNGAPAIGLSEGRWTVVTAYSRSEHGLFVPATMSGYDRSKED
jgi:hypothetical protein